MATANRVPLTLVTAGVIRDEHGRVLLARRPDDRHMGGLWEFPGGKVTSGEDPAVALARELEEELGVDAEVEAPITFALHHEPGLSILLLFFAARIGRGQPRPREGQELIWVHPAELDRYPTPPADAVLVRQLVTAAARQRAEGGSP